MGSRRAYAFLIVAFSMIVAAVLACGHKNNGKPIDAPGTGCTLLPLGPTCTTPGQCCSGNCDPMMHICTMGACAAQGSSCNGGADCCSASCVNNVCGASCAADANPCTQNGECCSGQCGSNGACTPLAGCLATGNPCTQGGTGSAGCCSGNCNASDHCGPSSYCIQNSDSCTSDSQCCGGLCTVQAGNTVKTCTQPSVGGTNCTGVDGSVCNDCGGCCSRLCLVYAPTGTKICQPAEGCHIDGDICYSANDCCGGPNSGLPGQGHVQCVKQNASDPVGICRNPMSCAPEGAVCHYLTVQQCGNSSSRNDCCDNLGNKNGQCLLDALGIPRCFGLGSGCQMAGSGCSNSLDCCNGNPCVFNGSGFACSGSACVQAGSGCSQTADCCNGQTCIFQAGQITGTCGGGTMNCQQLGQDCNSSMPCCANEGTCTNVATGSACGASQTTGCTCQNAIF
jgi:hypothetical protein